MKDYLLFIDTEASGLPKKWDLPYSTSGNWPYAVQVSWVIYSKDGKKIREQNHYISNNDFDICATAFRIHGLTKNFLQHNGIPLNHLLGLLAKDVGEYQPMIVGHFLELDYHILAAGYYREGIDNPFNGLSTFCIMMASRHLQQNPHNKYLRLGDLYELLFKKPLVGQHNALTDAAATAECFFELLKRNEIGSFTQPPIIIKQKEKLTNWLGWIIALLLLLFSAFLIISYYG